MKNFKLTYFHIKLHYILGEPIRFLFHAAGVPFQDIRLEEKDWLLVKENTKWGLLPVLDVDGTEISETSAIARFLANEFGMAGSSPIEAAFMDEIVDVCKGIRLEWIDFYMENDGNRKSELKENLLQTIFPHYFSKFEKIISENGSGWIVGKMYSWADILLATFIEKWEFTVDNNITNEYPRLKNLKDAVFSIPGIARYVSTRHSLM